MYLDLSFSSLYQDPVHKVDNLLHQSSQWKRWLCAPGDRSGSIQAEFQLEKAAKIGYVDLGKFAFYTYMSFIPWLALYTWNECSHINIHE